MKPTKPTKRSTSTKRTKATKTKQVLKQSQPEALQAFLSNNPEVIRNEEWLTTDEVVKHLNISRSTIYRLRKKRVLPSFVLGRIPMYPKVLLNKVMLQRAINSLKKE
ncbi:helix-turn-helix domain-containing protein [Winogradskyella rapida]|uniref:Helix-turn-helix domain-containing protein n=1 Tax=Winogradskyella rapida TaxID=549701 RepID=A0ABW3KPR3_9FLAO